MTKLWTFTRRGTYAALAAATLLLPTAAAAQDAGAAGLDGARMLYEMVRGHIMTTANEATDDLLAYRPTAEVRTLGELLGHIGNASYAFCSAALGEDSPATGNLEEAPDKAALVAGLTAGFAYCDRAYAELSGARLAEPVSLFGINSTRVGVLIFNASHDWEHYGNIVTYLRMNGIVPPSSRGGM